MHVYLGYIRLCIFQEIIYNFRYFRVFRYLREYFYFFYFLCVPAGRALFTRGLLQTISLLFPFPLTYYQFNIYIGIYILDFTSYFIFFLSIFFYISVFLLSFFIIFLIFLPIFNVPAVHALQIIKNILTISLLFTYYLHLTEYHF